MKRAFKSTLLTCGIAWLLPLGAGAHAADLGGACCADLEERIAELEATTARKGTRKVSLAITGWLNNAVFFWDDGVERNAYVATNGLEQGRFRLLGEAAVTNDVSAGYFIEINVFGANSATFSQGNSGGTSSIGTGKSNWYVRSQRLGKVTVGLQSTATEHLLDDADPTMTRVFADVDATRNSLAAFNLRIGGTQSAALWADILSPSTPGQSGVRNAVRCASSGFLGQLSVFSKGVFGPSG